MSIVIGLTGYKRCGKDTVGEILEKEYGFKRWAFADKLRDMCSDLFDIPLENFLQDDLKDAVDERYNMTPREILIHIGTPGCRHVDPNVWLHYVIRQIKADPDSNHVVTDVRFPNECQGIVSLGLNAHCVRIERKGTVLGNDIPTSGLIDNYMYTIKNDGTIDDLKVLVAEMYETMQFLYGDPLSGVYGSKYGKRYRKGLGEY